MRRNGIAVLDAPSAARALRCAVYTRKSTEEGLEQEFNTLDAQREACEAFVLSQRGEGWDLLPSRYDDGGYSGANMERPALRRLMADVEAGRVQVVVVYKLDRLSRSLLDFTKLMEVFDTRKVAFVSVTQHFDTSTSMGRLMLHILLSFAQFEREMIAERTRDKIGAARRRGKWTGGMQVLGYDVAPGGGRLLLNEGEAERVREIFTTYLREESLRATAALMNARGFTTKGWTTREGRERRGRPFDKLNLRSLLMNPLYAGRISCRGGETVPGEHPAIVPEEVWDGAQRLLRHGARTGGSRARNKYGALLREILRCGACDAAMSHAYSVRRGKRYRYYVCGKALKQGWAACPTKSVPAGEIERFVVERIRAVGADEGLVAATVAAAREQQAKGLRALQRERAAAERVLRSQHADEQRLVPGRDAARLAGLRDRLRDAERGLTDARERLVAAEAEAIDEGDLARALSLFDPVWDALFPKEQARVLRLLIERVTYDGGAGTLSVTFRPSGIKALAGEVVAGTAEARR